MHSSHIKAGLPSSGPCRWGTTGSTAYAYGRTPTSIIMMILNIPYSCLSTLASDMQMLPGTTFPWARLSFSTDCTPYLIALGLTSYHATPLRLQFKLSTFLGQTSSTMQTSKPSLFWKIMNNVLSLLIGMLYLSLYMYYFYHFQFCVLLVYGMNVAVGSSLSRWPPPHIPQHTLVFQRTVDSPSAPNDCSSSYTRI